MPPLLRVFFLERKMEDENQEVVRWFLFLSQEREEDQIVFISSKGT